MTGRARPPKPKAPEPLTVVLVDDHPMWRDTLRRLLERRGRAKVVAEVADGAAAVEAATSTSPDVVVMDVNLPDVDGIEATRRITREMPGCKVLMLASSDERSLVLDAVRAGAVGYLLKTSEPDDIVDALDRIQRGDLVFPSAIGHHMLEELRNPAAALPRVAVVAANPLDREGFVRVLHGTSFEVVAAVGRAEELPADAHPDVLVVSDDGVDDIASAATRASAVLVLARTVDADRALGLLAGSGPVIGYLRADRIAHTDEIAGAITRLAAGEPVVDTNVVDGLVDRRKQVEALDSLSAREREVLALMAEGHSNGAIGARLYLGQKTVEAHIRSVFTKLGLEATADSHRRVLAVLAFLQRSPDSPPGRGAR